MTEMTGREKAYPRAPRLIVTITDEQGRVVGETRCVVGEDFMEPIGGTHANELLVATVHTAARTIQAGQGAST